jgi:hypothetical protein
VLIAFYIIASLATLSTLPVLWVAAQRWGGLSIPRRLVAAAAALSFLMDLTMFTLGRMGINNLWVSYVGAPAETALLLSAFSYWQRHEVTRLALRLSVPLVLALWVVAAIGWESTTEFSRFTAPFQSVLLLAVAAYTVVMSGGATTEPVLHQDWLWFGIGVMLYYGAYAVVEPVSRLLLPSAPSSVLIIFGVRAAVAIIANLFFFKGMRCPEFRLSFGGSWWQPPLWRPSSSSQ